MNYDDTTSRPAPSYLIPFALLAISFAVLQIYQIVNSSKQHSAMEDTKKQLTEIIGQREALVKQSGELQAKLQAMAVDLLDLAKTDERAKAIVQKYNIQQVAPAQGTQGTAAAPVTAPAATPTPAK